MEAGALAGVAGGADGVDTDDERIEAIMERHSGRDVAVVTHGLTLTLYLAGLLELDAATGASVWRTGGRADVM